MNTQRIQKIFGVIFLLATLSADTIFAGDRQKNNSILEQLNTKETFTVYARGTSYPPNADSDTKKGKTSSLIPIKTVRGLGFLCIAVDPRLIPYGSVIVGRDKNGNKIIGVAVDTGGDVKNRKAARVLALKNGFSKDSPEYKAPVLDFYSSTGDITKYWDSFTVIPYQGPDFKSEMDQHEKIAYLKAVKEKYLDNPQLLASL